MGRKGYKGVTAIGQGLYLINDDGDHVIKMCEIINQNQCNISIIAGQIGKEGTLDHDIGTQALLSRPGR
jgi:hypothetical protein